MSVRKIKENIFSVGVNDWDRKLFDAFIPLPHGTSYNSYVVKGSEKTALIDTVDPDKWSHFKSNLEQLNLNKLDYIVSNHAEQDHSGSIPMVLEMFPAAKLVTNSKCKDLLIDLLNISENQFEVIKNKEGDTLSLGDKTLQFITAPWVHWPETMFTFLQEDKLLFSCDLFGSHLATSNLYADDERLVYMEAKRYYAQIMMPYAKSVGRYLQIVESLQPEKIAPSHGPVYRNPEFILNAHQNWISDRSQNLAVIFYVSMHGSTQKMVESLCESLINRDIDVKLYNLINADYGEIAMSLVDAETLIFASPAFLIGAHPLVLHAANLVRLLKPKVKFIALIGSYGWGNKVIDELTNTLIGLKAEFLTSVLAKGAPSSSTFSELENLAHEISERHKSAKT